MILVLGGVEENQRMIQSISEEGRFGKNFRSKFKNPLRMCSGSATVMRGKVIALGQVKK